MNTTTTRRPAEKAAFDEHAHMVICYALCKQIPDMERGFTVHTTYGDIEVDRDEARVFVASMKKLFQNKLKGMQK
ncbi:hypothetical protein AGMMS49545_10410 [Betaproteobacteria bacterium]|nr:hypothetical protein AGMMS49545_10410 [Betaproteobacteria bacterium]GHU44363.1 hypothetical protein AGMMS50289_12490 [Betaproteobacteria bacterium]